MREELDQLEREFLESLMEALKVRRMSASEDDELRIRNVEIRERNKGNAQVVAIGGGDSERERERERDWLFSSQFFLYISEVGKCE